MTVHIVLDTEKGEVVTRFGEDDQRVVLVASEAFVKMMEALNAFGTAGFTMFHMMGREKGRYEVLKEMEALRQRGTSFTKRQMLENIVYQVRITGWGSPRIHKYDEQGGALTIRVDNNPFINALRKGGELDWLCHFFRGYWVGVASEILERKMSCTVTANTGIRDTCEFKITPTKHTRYY
jgi:predicted hydrocarbon binding protein